MHPYSVVISILLGLATFGQAMPADRELANLIPADTYKRSIAPQVLQRITDFRVNKRSLTGSQHAYLDNIAERVKRADSTGLSEVAKEGEHLFGRDALNTVFYGDAPKGYNEAELQARGLAGTQAVECECTNKDQYCANGFTCLYRHNQCEMQSKGCGHLWLYVCNGLCVD